MSVRDRMLVHVRCMSRNDLVVFILMVGNIDNVKEESVDAENYKGKRQLRLVLANGHHVNFPYTPMKDLAS